MQVIDVAPYREKQRTYHEIRTHGAIANLAEGLEIVTHGLETRLIAWPGNGFQNESIHVLTVQPGQESARWAYDGGEEAFLCFAGEGEVFVQGRWVPIAPGDMAFFPPGVERALRGTTGALRVVNAISPPPIHLYIEPGFYDRQHGVMLHDAIEAAKQKVVAKPFDYKFSMEYRDTAPEVRARNLTLAQIASGGALYNLYDGADFGGLGVPMRMVLWPGHGARLLGYNYGPIYPGQQAHLHTHPVSDECVLLWDGALRALVGEHWFDLGALDVILAPGGVKHGGGPTAETPHPGCLLGGFASPPQPDLLLLSDYYQDGRVKAGVPFTKLTI